MTSKIDIKDKDYNNVYFGDKFLAHMIIPSFQPGTIVTVVKDESKENLSSGRNYDVEDRDGNRIWNAYLVIRHGHGQRNKS